MARRKIHEEPENHERWLVSYADFITLLFAFFVVMYSISSVNEGKYRVLSDALEAAFRSPPKSLAPIQIGQPVLSTAPAEVIGTDAEAHRIRPIDLPLAMPAGTAFGDAPSLSELARRMGQALQPLIDDRAIRLEWNDQWLEIEINTAILFGSGEAALGGQARSTLRQIAEILAPMENPIYVQGFTDNLPINTVIYPSNWELSAARAASVVHLFSGHGVDPARMAAIGFAEFQPVADNATAEGRARNRRVVILVRALAETGVAASPGEAQDAAARQALDDAIGEGMLPDAGSSAGLDVQP